jgi:hypothetical protein
MLQIGNEPVNRRTLATTRLLDRVGVLTSRDGGLQDIEFRSDGDRRADRQSISRA